MQPTCLCLQAWHRPRPAHWRKADFRSPPRVHTRLGLQHAYYLQYKNVRPDYLKAIWRIVNWQNVEQRLAAAKN